MKTIESTQFEQGNFEPEREFGTPEDDYQVYLVLKDLFENGKFATRWKVRDFEDDPYGLLRIDKAHIGILNNGIDRAKPMETFGSLLISDKSRNDLNHAFRTVFKSAEIREHREKGGMIIFVPVPHTTNADIPVSAGIAGQDLNIALNQTILIHRQVPLSELRFPNEFGEIQKIKIVDDGLLLYSGILQTFPDSVSGKDDRLKIYRDKVNLNAMQEFIKLKDKGGQILWNSASGTELSEYGTVGRVSPGSAKLLYKYNRKDAGGTYKDLVMTIPYVIDINPFTPEGATDAPFEFLKPLYLHKEEDVHEMMKHAVEIANKIKRPATPFMHYETEEEFQTRLG